MFSLGEKVTEAAGGRRPGVHDLPPPSPQSSRGGAFYVIGASSVLRLTSTTVSSCGADEGSRWAGRAGTVEWLGSLGDDDYCLSNEDTYALAKAKEHGSSLGKEENPERLARLGVRLGDLAEEWATLVRATNRERVPGQLQVANGAVERVAHLL